MNTPLCDFVAAYRDRGGLRLHMPGHKGWGAEANALDITEIQGADELYHARGVIRESEENAAALFESGRTVYSAEGSSLCIRAMLYLALLDAREKGRPPVFLAGRNAHKTLMTGAALLNADVQWLWGAHLLECPVDADQVERALQKALPAGVYVTTPDYLGHITDIAPIARVCRRYQVPLLVDNAHGAYLKFLPKDRHPLSLGADMACDSAHKTLPVLTGGAYLHIGKDAPPLFARQAERAMALFASTSPSYLILQSLDRCNRYLAEGYKEKLAAFLPAAETWKERLRAHGYTVAGDEPLKITLAPKLFGYTGNELHAHLRAQGMECEFSDPDFLVMMLTPEMSAREMERMGDALLSLPRRPAVEEAPPPVGAPERAMSIREALFAPSEKIPVAQALGRVLADPHVGCPPAVPPAVCGERMDASVQRCLTYYGVEEVWTVAP